MEKMLRELGLRIENAEKTIRASVTTPEKRTEAVAVQMAYKSFREYIVKEFIQV